MNYLLVEIQRELIVFNIYIFI